MTRDKIKKNKKRDKVDRMISDVLFEFTHLWVEGFGWEVTIMMPSDFDRILKIPSTGESDGQVFIAYNFDENNQKIEIKKFKGSC